MGGRAVLFRVGFGGGRGIILFVLVFEVRKECYLRGYYLRKGSGVLYYSFMYD